MADLNINITTQNTSDNNSTCKNEKNALFIFHAVIPSIGLPLILVAIYALYTQVRKDRVAPIYVINLLISDLIQLCCLIVFVTRRSPKIDFSMHIHIYSLMTSIGFMVCVALERYLVIACPVWYRFKRTIKNTVVVCIVVWVVPLFFIPPAYLWKDFPRGTVLGIFLLLPFPFFIFFLGGTLKALSSSRVPSERKRRIVGILVLVLLIYTLLFLPEVCELLAKREIYNKTFGVLSEGFIFLNPLADLTLYIFMRKGTVDKLLARVCCRMDPNNISTSNSVSHSSVF